MAHVKQYGRQLIDREDIRAVTETLGSDFLTQGPKAAEFESELARTVGSSAAVVCSSGTAGLHLAMLALEIGPGDTVWTTPITFVASANVALYVGANVDLVDIDDGSWNISPQRVAEKIEHYRQRRKTLPKAIVVVHFAGCPADTKTIREIVEPHGIRIIEDASHALGASTPTEHIGSCQHSDMAVFSFHPVKNITTGEGGAVTTSSALLESRLRQGRTHGINRDVVSADEPWRYDQETLGFNYRLSDIQSALGLTQLKKLNQFIGHRSRLHEQYLGCLSELPDIKLQSLGENQSAHHLMVVRVPHQRRLPTYRFLQERQIGVQVHYLPIYEHAYYKALGVGDRLQYPASAAYYSETLSLPMHANLTVQDIDRVCDSLIEALDVG